MPLTGLNYLNYTATPRKRVIVAIITYRYCFKVDGKVVLYGITTDLERSEHEHLVRWPNGQIEQVGDPTSHEEAWYWEKEQSKRLLSSAS